MIEIDRRQLLAQAALLGGGLLSGCAGPRSLADSTDPLLSSFRPGQVWLDTSGKPIQAHAGAVIAVGDSFYWYGENKEYTDGKQGIESWGIRFYRSKDLYNWEDLGPLIPPDLNDPTSPLSQKIFPERPHILFNPRTRKYVCWIKIRPRGMAPQFRTVMVADSVTGPYRMVHRELFPAGMPAGDFDLMVDEKTGQAFMYFEHEHREVVCIQLTEDWTGVNDRFSRHMPGSPPDTREGIACFQRGGRYYLTSSGMTGYFPNPSQVAVADSPHGPFTDLGDLHPTDKSRTSFNSQISYIFKHPRKKELYIALADRWLPEFAGRADFESGELSENVRSAIRKATAKPRQSLTEAERKAIPYAAALSNVNTSISRYVWLPILFRAERPTIEWRDEWRIEDFK